MTQTLREMTDLMKQADLVHCFLPLVVRAAKEAITTGSLFKSLRTEKARDLPQLIF